MQTDFDARLQLVMLAGLPQTTHAPMPCDDPFAYDYDIFGHIAACPDGCTLVKKNLKRLRFRDNCAPSKN